MQNLKNLLSKDVNSWAKLNQKLISIDKAVIANRCFQIFAKNYLLWTRNYKQFYLFDEIPSQILKKNKFLNNVKNIDLLLVDKKNHLIAVQCTFAKNFSKSIRWKQDKLESFLATKHFDKYVLFTNRSKVDPQTVAEGKKTSNVFSIKIYQP